MGLAPWVAGLFALSLGVVDLLAWATLAARLWGSLAASPRLEEVEPAVGEGVEAVVAMRNEEENVEGCVVGLLAQGCVRRVIVVDDHSTDQTLAKAKLLAQRDGRVEVVRLDDDSLGGKADACWVGAKRSEAPWLLFVDADTRVSPDTVGRALGLAQKCGADAVSLLGGLRCRTTLGCAFTALNNGMLNAFVSLRDVNDPAKRQAYFVGSFTLVRREKYFAVGGHGAVSGRIVEDKALGEIFKRRGFRVVLAYAPKHVSAAWGESDGVFASMVREITPFMAQAGKSRSAAFSFAMSVLHLAPYVALALAATVAPQPLRPPLLLVGAGSLALALVFQALSAKISGIGWRAVPAYFGAMVVQIAAFWAGAYNVWRGRPVKWRGRLHRPL